MLGTEGDIMIGKMILLLKLLTTLAVARDWRSIMGLYECLCTLARIRGYTLELVGHAFRNPDSYAAS